MKSDSLIDTTPWAFYGVPDDKSILRADLAWERKQPINAVDPYFSLLTPLWNTPPQFLEELIQSCLLQSFSSWELILWDDGSSKTEHWPIAELYAAKDPRIVFRKGEKNAGISGARNQAFAISRGQYVAILDHDDLLHPRTLFHFYRLSLRDPAQLIFCNEAKVDSKGVELSDFFYKPRFDLGTLVRTNYIAHFAAARRDALVKMSEDKKLFRPEYDGVEDHDYFLRLASIVGFRALHSPVFGYLWRKSPNSTAEDLNAKPYARERLGKLIEDYSAGKLEISWSPGQRLPALHSKEKSHSPLAFRVLAWGGAAKEEKFRGKIAGQKQVNPVEIGFFSGEISPFDPMDGQEYESYGEDRSLPTLVVHESVDFPSENTLFQLLQFLQDNQGYDSVSPGMLDKQGKECGDFAFERGAGGIDPGVLHGQLNESDFPRDQRIGLIPSHFAIAIRSLPEQLWKTAPQKALGYALTRMLKKQKAGHFYLGDLRCRLAIDTFPSMSFDEVSLGRNEMTRFLADSQMSYDPDQRWLHGSRDDRSWRNIPLRYRVADVINNYAKRYMKPLHALAKRTSVNRP